MRTMFLTSAAALMLAALPARAEATGFELQCEGHHEAGTRACFAFTLGFSLASRRNHDMTLVYQCEQRGNEYLYFMFSTDGTVDMDLDEVPATWRGKRRKETQSIPIRVVLNRQYGRSIDYLYEVSSPAETIIEMVQSKELHLKPKVYRHGRARTTKFDVRGAVATIREAMNECRLENSQTSTAIAFGLGRSARGG